MARTRGSTATKKVALAEPLRDITIKICMGTGGIAAGSRAVAEEFQSQLASSGIKSAIVKRCVNKTGCRGFCAKDVLVDVISGDRTETYQLVTPEKVNRIVTEHIIGGIPVKEWLVSADYHAFHDKQTKRLLSQCGIIDPEDIDAYIRIGGYEGLKKALSSKPADVIAAVKESGIRGRGGAGFPTGVKWEIASQEKAAQKYIICNADEGDPGAFMDRSVIEGNPHSVLEGLIIGGYAIGAHQGFIYIRAEYPLAIERLEIAISQAQKKGFLGKNILGTGFDFGVKIKQGAGAFICGEETALIASIEGKRGMPRSKPPFPVSEGLWGKPTVINNVETLANIPSIIKNGAPWFASIGTEKSKGTKVFALTGKIKNSGLIEVPIGISLKEIIYDIGGGIERDRKLKAVQTGGPSGGCIPAANIDMPVDYESLVEIGSMMGSGGMIVMDETTCMVEMATFFLSFTQNESCGKCVPCRVGTKRMLEILTRITEGQGRDGDIDLLIQLGTDIKLASLCGLGQSAPNPVLSTIRFFRHEYEAHIKEKRCPAHACKAFRHYLINPEMCKMCGRCFKVCPTAAISWQPKHKAELNKSKCVKCGSCYKACPFNAII